MCKDCEFTAFGFTIEKNQLAFIICIVFCSFSLFVYYPIAIEEANCRITCNEMIANATKACVAYKTGLGGDMDGWEIPQYGSSGE